VLDLVIRNASIADGTGRPRFSHVIVNGEVIIDRGKPSGARPGQVLRAGRRSTNPT
jgi:N-acyl-D-aspartate/D-glutamate deacylase